MATANSVYRSGCHYEREEEAGPSSSEDRARSPTIFAFVKLYDDIGHAQQFVSGKLYLNTLQHFKEYEDKDGELRGDPLEGISGMLQPSELGPITFGPATIQPEELRGPVLTHREEDLALNALCLYSLNTGGHQTVSAANLSKLKETFRIHQKNFGLGTHAVVVNAKPFIVRVRKALEAAKLGARMTLVEYFDEATFHGFFKRQQIGFMKAQRFAHQREYRILVRGAAPTPGPFVLDVGDLSDITWLTTPDQFNESITLRLPDGSKA